MRLQRKHQQQFQLQHDIDNDDGHIERDDNHDGHQYHADGDGFTHGG